MLKDATTYQWQGRQRQFLMPPPEQGAEWCAIVHWNKPETPFYVPDAGQVSSLYTAEARVERGAWTVDCPCGGAQWACRTDRRLFCPDCLNAYAGGDWVPVTWPKFKDEAAIETLLEARPFAVNQNWYPHESVGDLKRENADNGWAA